MKTVEGIYENGEIRLLENVTVKTAQKILVTFFEETDLSEEEVIRQLSLMQPSAFMQEYLSDEREDLYQEYVEKIPK